jgi:hypothetical protein
MWPFTRMMATRTRPKTLSASRRRRRPELECLEEKKVLSITFGSYPDGTWAFNSDAGTWRHLNEADPIAMHEGADGTLFASYNNGPFLGTWRYDFGPNQWTEVTGAVASTLSASSKDNTLFASFSGQGTWEFNGSWHQLASHDATMLAAVSNNDVYAVFSGDKTGTWQANNNGWNKLTSAVPVAMDASPGGALYVSYGDGTYEYNGGWTQLDDRVATQIAALSITDSFVNQGKTAFFATFPGTDSFGEQPGTWEFFENGVGTLRFSEVASHLGHGGSTLIGAFGDGTWTFDGATGLDGWSHIDDTEQAFQFG